MVVVMLGTSGRVGDNPGYKWRASLHSDAPIDVLPLIWMLCSSPGVRESNLYVLDEDSTMMLLLVASATLVLHFQC